MGYTAKQACETLDRYLNLSEKEIIENTKQRDFVLTLSNEEKVVIFTYPIVHKQDNSKNYFDTRDSGAYERAVAWNYSLEHGYKYFCIGVNDQVEKYKNYVFSLECDEKTIEKLSGTKNGKRSATERGNQIIIPNGYIPSRDFVRIRNDLGTFISIIHVDSIYDYLEKYDNRPYMSDNDVFIELNTEDNDNDKSENLENEKIDIGTNIIFYGVPGAGKSYQIDKIINQDRSERVVFHPDYTYSDFVGQILPKVIGDKLQYTFIPGPFTRILKRAIEDKEHKMYYLVIEEINRGNAPAIFGDIFQLLDRNRDGSGKYRVSNSDIAKIVYNDENRFIRIPGNLTILATMNTSDQNIFTLDTAFQRRWDMCLIKNDIVNAEHACLSIEGSEVSWGGFAKITNTEILNFEESLGGIGDKRLGAYFIQTNELDKKNFSQKVLKYLWDDAFKMDHSVYFNEKIASLDNIIDIFNEESSETDSLKKVLNDTVYEKMIDASQDIERNKKNVR